MAVFQPIVFKLGNEIYGVYIAYVNAIEQGQEIVRVPNSSGNIKGIINLRGEVIPVVDLKAKFKSASASSGEDSGQLIIVKLENRKIAKEVEGVEKIQHLEEKDIVDMPVIAKGTGVEYFSKVAKVDGRLIIMIEPEKLLSESESSIVDTLVN